LNFSARNTIIFVCGRLRYWEGFGLGFVGFRWEKGVKHASRETNLDSK
jgi:hypothetical protein